MHTRWFSAALLAAGLVSASVAHAAETKAVTRGATRDEVIAAFGRPSGQTKAANIEILQFSDRQVRLENGRVARITLRTTPKATKAAPTGPDAPTAGGAVAPQPAPSDSPFAAAWLSNFETALQDAARRDAVILALFTSSDASPSARQFQKEIVLHPEFVNAFRARYVLLNVDYPARGDMTSEAREQDDRLRERYDVGSLPALRLISSAGEKLAAVAISDAVPGSAFRSQLITATTAAYELPALKPPEPPAAEVATPEPVVPTQIHVAPSEVTKGLFTARWLILAALAVGTLLAGIMLFVLWMFIRKINKPVALHRRSNMASRISNAASGLPSFAEIAAWPKEMLCHVTICLAETEGYVAEEQPVGSDKDLVLKRPGSHQPEIIVCCVTGDAGVMPTRRVRELVTMLATDDVPAGWYVAPAGFSLDARAFAEQHNVKLIDASVLYERLSDLPTFALPKVLATAR